MRLSVWTALVGVPVVAGALAYGGGVVSTARERGAEIIDLQSFPGHADPRTTLTYIRTRDRLSKSPAYVLNY